MIIFGLINIILIFKMWSGLAVLIFLMFNLAVFIFILQLALQVSLLKQTMQQIAAGGSFRQQQILVHIQRAGRSAKRD